MLGLATPLGASLRVTPGTPNRSLIRAYSAHQEMENFAATGSRRQRHSRSPIVVPLASRVAAGNGSSEVEERVDLLRDDITQRRRGKVPYRTTPIRLRAVSAAGAIV